MPPEMNPSVTKSLDNKSEVGSDNKSPVCEETQRAGYRATVPVSSLIDGFILLFMAWLQTKGVIHFR